MVCKNGCTLNFLRYYPAQFRVVVIENEEVGLIPNDATSGTEVPGQSFYLVAFRVRRRANLSVSHATTKAAVRPVNTPRLLDPTAGSVNEAEPGKATVWVKVKFDVEYGSWHSLAVGGMTVLW